LTRFDKNFHCAARRKIPRIKEQVTSAIIWPDVRALYSRFIIVWFGEIQYKKFVALFKCNDENYLKSIDLWSTIMASIKYLSKNKLLIKKSGTLF